MRTGRLDVSKEDTVFTAERPLTVACQASRRLFPTGAMMPSPVTTTRCIFITLSISAAADSPARPRPRLRPAFATRERYLTERQRQSRGRGILSVAYVDLVGD